MSNLIEFLSDKICNLRDKIDEIDALLETENIHYSGDYEEYDKDTYYYYYEDYNEDKDKDDKVRITTDSRVLQVELLREEESKICKQVRKEYTIKSDEYQREIKQR